MTDASNYRDIDQILPTENITTAVYVGATLWIGDKYGNVWINDKTDGSTSRLFKNRCILSPPLKNYKVKTLIPINEPKSMLVHYTSIGNHEGPVELIRAGGIRSKLPQNALFADTSFSVNKPRIILESNKTITFYKFIGEIPVKDFSIEVDGQVRALSACDKFCIYFSNNQYHQFIYATKETITLPTSAVTTPIAHTLSADSILCSFNDSIYIVNHEKKGLSFQHNSQNGVPTFYYGTKRSLYQFFKNCFTRTDLDSNSQPQVFQSAGVQVASMIGTELLVIAPQLCRIYGSIRPTNQLLNEVKNGKIDTVFATFDTLPEDLCSANMIALFSELWPFDPKIALQFTKRYLWLGDPRQLLILFPQLVLDSTPEKRMLVPNGPVVTITPTDFRKDVFELLQSSLEFMLDRLTQKNPDSKDLKCLSTALLQVYAITLDTKKFAKLIRTNANVDCALFEQFINPLIESKFPLAPCLAVYYTYRGNSERAIDIWKQLYNASHNEMFLSEASNTIKEISDTDKFRESLDWLKSVNAKYISDAVMSTKQDQNIVVRYLDTVKQVVPEARMAYFDFIAQQPNILPEAVIIQECFDSYIAILEDVAGGQVKPEKVRFTESFKSGATGSDLTKKVGDEIVRKTKDLLKKHIDLIDPTSAMQRIAGKAIDKSIKLTIFRVTERYADGIKEIIGSQTDTVPFTEIEEFCRTSPNPPKAFDTAFSIIPSEKLFTKRCEFIMNNIAYIDPVETIKKIPKNTEVRSISDIIRILFNLLTQRNEELDKQLAITKSMQVDASYYLARERAKYGTIEDNNTKCFVCQKYINPQNNLCIMPDGSICHPGCKPK